MILVHYTDGSTARYNSLAEAEEGISEEVFGCNFAITVDSIEDEDDPERNISATFSVEVKER